MQDDAVKQVNVRDRPRRPEGRDVPEADVVRDPAADARAKAVVARSDYEKSSLTVHAPATYEATAQASGGGKGALVAGSILAGIVLPFLLACIYYLAVATPQYIAEARFAVRTLGGTDVGTGLGGGGLLGMTPLPQDAYVVTSFIHSPAILDRLSERVDFDALFTGQEIDYWSRLKNDFSREDLLDYWQEQVGTYLDGPSGIVTLRVRAFSPEDATMLAQAVIDESENLANELSVRARADYVERAEQEVGARHSGYRAVLERLNELRNETTILDPTQRATETGTLLTGLMAQKLDVDARLFVLEQQMASESPSVRQLRGTQAALASQIEALRAQLADDGTVDENLSLSFRRFAELETERMLASELYAAARRNLSHAQAEAIRKAVYVAVFVPPALAEDSRYPRRIAMPLLILLGFTVAWGIGALIWASVEDHRT